jgi:predicted O-methyltransferase YrrM
MPFEILYESPAQMVLPERMLLFALIYGLRPTLALEIGTAEGGSAMIICAAMDMAGCGKLVCVDPNPKIAPEHWSRIAHRTALVSGASSEVEVIRRAAGGENVQFDFVLVDGDHAYQGVLNDIEIVSQFLHEGSYVLFHDAHFVEVKEAIDASLRQYPFLDCGLLSLEAKQTETMHLGQQVRWGGLRLLRFHPSGERLAIQDKEPPSGPTELDLILLRVRERVNCLSGWSGLVVRKPLKLAYHTLLEIGKRLV